MHIHIPQRYSRLAKPFLGAGAILAACVLVLFSLRITPNLSDHEAQRLSHKEIYLSGPILPDHLLYPVFRIPERIQLLTLRPEDAILYRLELSQKRLQDARSLLDKGNEVLAIVALQKSQAYALEASRDALAQPVSQPITKTVAQALYQHMSEIDSVRHQFVQQDATSVGQMKAQTEVYLSQLDASQARLN